MRQFIRVSLVGTKSGQAAFVFLWKGPAIDIVPMPYNIDGSKRVEDPAAFTMLYRLALKDLRRHVEEADPMLFGAGDMAILTWLCLNM